MTTARGLALARWFAPRVALALLSVLVTLGSLELGLRLLRAAAAGKHPGLTVPEGKVVLALGESTVYGLYVEAHQSFPSLVVQALNRQKDRGVFQLVNSAFPAAISDDVLRVARRDIPRYRPAIVLATLGNNDFSASMNYRRQGIRHPWQQELLLVRVLTWVSIQQGWIAGVDRTEHRVLYFHDADRPTRPEWSDMSQPAWEEIAGEVKQNLQALSRLCKEHGAYLVIVGYLNSIANPVLRDWSKKRYELFVENGVRDKGLHERLVFHHTPLGALDGFHPNVEGHRRIAARVTKVLLRYVARPLRDPEAGSAGR